MTPALASVQPRAERAPSKHFSEFPSWPHFSEDEIAAVVEVLRSGRVSYWTGEHCRRFEEEFAGSCGCKHAVAVANGTVALELALRCLGIGPADEVIVPSRTFVASASSIAMCGARPVFADVEADSQNITAATIESALTNRTRAIIAVHLAGWPCDMDSILELARRYDLRVIEDCAQAQGAKYRGLPVGSFGDAATFSFCQDKVMTTVGEGGMLVTNDSAAFERAWAFKDHGKDYSEIHREGRKNGFPFPHRTVGTNWRMTEVQAVVGRRQLAKVPEWVEQRRRNADILAARLSKLQALRIPAVPDHVTHARYRFYAFVRPAALKSDWGRNRIVQQISAAGVPCSAGSCGEVYLEDAFVSSRPETSLPVARDLAETSIAFVVHPTLTEAHMHAMSNAIAEIIEEATLPQ
jgi:hypothetical protein